MMISFDRRVWRFGTGDIQIAMGSEPKGGFLVFRNLDQPRPIGAISRPANSQTEKYELQYDDVVMSFSCPESIDALMNCLAEIRVRAFGNSEAG